MSGCDEAGAGQTIALLLATYEPDLERLGLVLDSLRVATQDVSGVEVLLVENGSTRLGAAHLSDLPGARLVQVARPGLSNARRVGIRATSADLIVFVDDDTVLARDFVARARASMAANPRVGVAGGRIAGRFAVPPSFAQRSALPFLAVRDLGDRPVRITGPRPTAEDPVGACMVLRRAVAEAFAESVESGSCARLGRTGSGLAAGEDSLVCLLADDLGFERAYWPELALEHLIEARRLDPAYLRRLIRGIGASAAELQALRHGPDSLTRFSRTGIALRFVRDLIRHGPGAVYTIQWYVGYEEHRGHLDNVEQTLP